MVVHVLGDCHDNESSHSLHTLFSQHAALPMCSPVNASNRCALWWNPLLHDYGSLCCMTVDPFAA